jgi:hypothetical protein
MSPPPSTPETPEFKTTTATNDFEIKIFSPAKYCTPSTRYLLKIAILIY